MNKQNITKYTLAVALVLIWGTLFYRIYLAVGADDDAAFPSQVAFAPTAAEVGKDSFSLLLGYSDPFRLQFKTKSAPRKSRRSRAKSVPKVVTPKPAKKVKFPAIVYKGFIENKSIKMVVLKIDGKSLTIKEGQSKGGLRISRAHPDSVLVFYEGKRKAFYRE